MTVQSTEFTPELRQYLRQMGTPEPDILAAIRRQTETHRLGKMAIAAEQAALLTWLAKLTGVRRYLEIGVFTGYSSTAMALALPEHARITACDINVTFTDQARRHWQAAGVAHKITLHLQPALITMDELIAQGQGGSYDMALIDADKPPTPHYFERALQLVRPGGIIAIDNVLLGGRVMEEGGLVVQAAAEKSPESHRILQAFNARLPHDERIETLTLPLGDGLTLVRKK